MELMFAYKKPLKKTDVPKRAKTGLYMPEESAYTYSMSIVSLATNPSVESAPSTPQHPS